MIRETSFSIKRSGLSWTGWMPGRVQNRKVDGAFGTGGVEEWGGGGNEKEGKEEERMVRAEDGSFEGAGRWS